MKQRYFFELSYLGTNYCGWQKQPSSPSVQETIENAISKLHSFEKIEVVGCGRTDTGVHASNYFLHVDLPPRFEPEQLKFKLNGILPSDIAIHNIIQVDMNNHARFDATKRTYHYFLHTTKNPFITSQSYFFPQKLDVLKMNEACSVLIGTKDFTSFSKLHTDVKTNICSVSHAKWVALENDTLRFEISANRFLRNMVRAIVGTLLDVGTGKLTYKDVEQILKQKNRNSAGFSAPGQGLFLAKVEYPFLNERLT